jgi:hypothetical protein
MKHNRHKRAIQARIGRQMQAGTGVGHRDLTRQAKKWMLFESVPFSNTSSNFAFGYNNVNISVRNAGIANAVYDRLMTQAALTYEEYRIRRVRVHAQPGTGYTNDQRIKSSIFARVDVNSQETAATIDNLNSLICSESSVNKTFTERSNVLLLDYRPICYSTGGSGEGSRPLLPSQLQWYNIEERDAHLWRGCTVAPIIPEPTTQPNALYLTVWIEVEMEFRSRRPDFANFTRETFSADANNDSETETETIKADAAEDLGDLQTH